MLRSRERITTNPDTKRLTKANIGRLCDSFICQGPRSGDNTDLAWLVDVTWLDAHLASERVDDTGAVGSDKTRLGLALESVHDLDKRS